MALDETKKCECGCNPEMVTKPSQSKKIIYYKLNSPYREDYTKNCGLVGSEIDQNFFNLKEMDIISANWDSVAREIVLTRVDGEELRVRGLYETFESEFNNFDFSYNPTSGTLSIVTPFETFDIKGFFTDDKLAMSNDDTLTGDGCLNNPLGVSPVAQTGTFKPINKVIETVEGESVETALNNLNPSKGDRFITVEKVSKFGRLYEFSGVQRIMEDLAKNSSEWRVPSKTDWDVMLSCVEGCVCETTDDTWHDSPVSNEKLGTAAGQRLKVRNLWEVSTEGSYTTEGTDNFGFSVLPVGYGDENGNASNGYGRYSAFWTSTVEDRKNDVYTKRFNYNSNKVYQGSTEPTERLSLRLVKTFNGKNFNESELINGMTYPCVLVTVPSDMKEDKINTVDGDEKVGLYATVWTQINVGFTNPDYLPKTRIVDTEWEGKEDFTTRHFVNHWDGQKWIKHELKSGDSIVIVGEYNGVEMHEWRVSKDAEGNTYLIDVVDVIKDELKESFKEEFDALNNKIDGEIERSTERDEELQVELDATQAGVGLEEDGSYRVEPESNYISEATSIADAILKIDGALKVEESERIANDIALEGHEFSATGGLLLKKNNGEVISIGFDANFGELPAPTVLRKNIITISQENVVVDGKRMVKLMATALNPVSSSVVITATCQYIDDETNEFVNENVEITIPEGEIMGMFMMMRPSIKVISATPNPKSDTNYDYVTDGDVSTGLGCLFYGVYPANGSDDDITVGLNGKISNVEFISDDVYTPTVEIPYTYVSGKITDDVIFENIVDVVFALDTEIKRIDVTDPNGYDYNEFMSGVVKTISVESPTIDGDMETKFYNVYRMKSNQFVNVDNKIEGDPVPFDIKIKIQ